jgi:hypothetical protein
LTVFDVTMACVMAAGGTMPCALCPDRHGGILEDGG